MKKIFIYGDENIHTNYKAAINNCGAIPFFCTDTSQTDDSDALLLVGGGDIYPLFYNQEITYNYNLDIKRDLDEFYLIKKFLDSSRPIFGICRGIQSINVALKGDLIQDIESPIQHSYDEKTGDQTHKVIAAKDSFLYKLYGEEFYVNSAHHQSILSIGLNLSISAKSPDGIIEAIESTEKKIYAVQFHPERMCFDNKRTDTVDGKLIFEFFISLL